MTGNSCRFTDLEAMARFCAELTRQGIAFTVDPGRSEGEYEVTITGY